MIDLIWPVSRRAGDVSRMQPILAMLVCSMLLIPTSKPARGETSKQKTGAPVARDTELQQPRHILPAAGSAARVDLNGASAISGPRPRQFKQPPARIRPATPAAHKPSLRIREPNLARQVNFQTSDDQPATPLLEGQAAPVAPASPKQEKSDPCASLVDKPFDAFGINIGMSGTKFPEDHATTCWAPINDSAGPLAGARCWSATTYAWNATCFYHRPLYFEEINLERYGYGCCESLQPAASAAHFFCTIPTLPYCIATDCPGDCEYTLGHYRPGNCNPWQCHWPRYTTRGALAEGGVWTGLVFLIP